MKVGQCPSCGAPVEFAAGTGKVKVCEHCHTVVLKGQAKLESLGKVAELVDTDSPLKVGLSGRFAGTGFTLVGRIQKSHGKGTWDEWCLALEDGRTAWLSESEGAWNLMFEGSKVDVPAYEALRPLSVVLLRDKRFVVEECGEASTVSAEGELPEFAAQHRYVDCTGPSGTFASLDFSEAEGPQLYIGSAVTLDQLGFDKDALSPTPRRQALTQARCTECNGPLDLKAPDRTRRVACPFCGALLDVSHGALSFLELLQKPPYAARIPLGSKGMLSGVSWTCIAFLIRSCEVEGTRYPWEEYLLWNVKEGFRWLMLSNGHWTFLTPVSAGEVLLGGRFAKYQGENFKQYQSVMATTDHVQGECYWELEAGEQAFAREFISPPNSLNIDETRNEATLTLGHMLSREEVAKAFALKAVLPHPQGIAPAQRNVWRQRATEGWKWSLLWAGALLAVFIVFSAMEPSGRYTTVEVEVPPDAKSGSPEAMWFSPPFEVTQRGPVEISLTCPEVSNSWCGVQVDLVNQDTDEVVSVMGEASYYFGSDSDGSWSEGSTHDTKTTDEVAKGTYVLRTTAAWEPTRPIHGFTVGVAGAGRGGLCFFLFLLSLLAWPLGASIAAGQFETRRWQDSVFQSASFS